MNKNCLFIQDSGIGDIFFLQKAAVFFTNLGYKVIWPILPQLLFLKDYLETPAHFFDLERFDKSLINENDLILNFQNADRMFPECKIMEAKYNLIGVDYSDWSNYFKFKRQPYKEDQLFNLLNPNNDDYILVSRNYGTPPNYKRADFSVQNGNNKVIEISFQEGFTIFDWCKLIENAQEIWMMDTSLNYIIDKVELKAKKLNLFSRRKDFSEIDYLFTTPWNYNF